MSDKPKCGCGKTQNPDGFCDGSHENNEEQVSFKEIKTYKFGEILMQLDKEELEDSLENEVKRIFGDIAELAKDSYSENKSPVKSLLFDNAICQIVNAELAVNKLLKTK
jgi:hypothetical protein